MFLSKFNYVLLYCEHAQLVKNAKILCFNIGKKVKKAIDAYIFTGF
jgi:hypothetical protein